MKQVDKDLMTIVFVYSKYCGLTWK